MTSEDMMSAEMFDKKVCDVLLEFGRKNVGIVFAGPPGSGKTTLLNWFLKHSSSDSQMTAVIPASSTKDAIDRMAEVAMCGLEDTSFDHVHAGEIFRTFQIIVYLENFKVQEISQCVGQNKEKGEMLFRFIYKSHQRVEK